MAYNLRFQSIEQSMLGVEISAEESVQLRALVLTTTGDFCQRDAKLLLVEIDRHFMTMMHAADDVFDSIAVPSEQVLESCETICVNVFRLESDQKRDLTAAELLQAMRFIQVGFKSRREVLNGETLLCASECE